MSYGNFTVTLIDSMEVANYCVRTLRLAKVSAICTIITWGRVLCVCVCVMSVKHVYVCRAYMRVLCVSMCVCYARMQA